MSKKLITNKQNTILILLLTFRFLNSKQIQQFLNHKDHRRINGWLKDLTEKEYIERDFTPIYGILTKPAVFNLSSNGRKYIRETYQDVSKKYLGKLREDTKRSKSFRTKCQVLADIYLAHYPDKVDKFLKEISENLNEGVVLEDNKSQFFTPAFYEVLEEIIPVLKLKPDAYMYEKDKEGITHCVFYVLDAYVPRLMLQYFLKNIFTTLDEEYWEEDNVLSLHIYVLCPNNMVIIYLRRLLKSFLERYYGGKELVFHFATRNQVTKRIKTKSGKTGWIEVSSEDEVD